MSRIISDVARVLLKKQRCLGIHITNQFFVKIIKKYYFNKVEKCLASISFPANKETLIQVAKNNHAPDAVMQLLNKIADEEYTSVTEIARETAEAKNA